MTDYGRLLIQVLCDLWPSVGYYVVDSGKSKEKMHCGVLLWPSATDASLQNCLLIVISWKLWIYESLHLVSILKNTVKCGGKTVKGCKCRRRKQLVKVRLYIVQPCWVFPMGPDGINSKWTTVATYFSSTNCFWYSSYSSRVIPAALAGSVGVASSSLSPPPPRPIPDRGFPIMLLIKKAILSCVTVYSARTTIIFCG